MIDWQDLLHFAALARTGSLSAAARELGVDHATVGRRIAALERSLDLRLIDRRPRTSPLTADGRAIAELVTGMEENVEAIRRYSKSAVTGLSAAVKVSAPPSIAAHLLAPKAALFREEHPDITLTIAGVTRRAALNYGEADIAVRMTRPEESDLLVRRIGIMRFGLYAIPTVAQRPEADWVFIGYDAAMEHLTQQTWLRSLLEGRPIVFRATDVFGQLEAARAGLGVVALPAFLGDSEAGLTRLPVAVPSPTRDLWLVTYPDLRRSPAIRAVMDFVSDIIGGSCPLRGDAEAAA
ncbi:MULTISPECIES: LysR family transcriptional regulator [unclassified Rhizobium]|uniref:LysR family transcriptional regulator n=1 Tax=unclassified Rhizobium TaxID=2613769 RepID=UPI000EA91DFC|nr:MULTISPECIES: LysR family transcriptional regulator [unclassified Rhizobium]AYG68021.1 LysR family transcriptional regulator [Rhizobium sp. CCGE531]AYG74406.1 LysR family transcriptional regulator [Rhizobium sp. CCGE532]